MRRAVASALLASCCATGCVRDAVLENDVRSAQDQARVLSTISDLEQAEAALAAQLVELEALYLRAPQEPRVRELLTQGYFRMAGFIEAHRLEASAAGDAASARHQEQRERAALDRAVFYGGLGPVATPVATLALGRHLGAQLSLADTACRAHDRLRHDAVLSALLAQRDARPETRLNLALAQRFARSLLRPEVSVRCAFR